MLRWFGVPEAKIVNLKNPSSKLFILGEDDINLDDEHPPEEALDSEITLMKEHLNNAAWKKVSDSCK